jgi:hypothetical protein
MCLGALVAQGCNTETRRLCATPSSDVTDCNPMHDAVETQHQFRNIKKQQAEQEHWPLARNNCGSEILQHTECPKSRFTKITFV